MTRTGTALYGVAGALLSVVVWQVVASMWSGSAIAGPASVWTAAVELAGDPDFWAATWTTLLMAARGLVAATVVGALAGILIGSSRVIANLVLVPMEFLKPIPPIVILPIAILVLGPTKQMGEALIFYGCVLPIAYTTANGVRETDPVAVQTARSFGLSTWQVLRRVTLPSTSAFIGTAVRIAMPHAFVIAVVAGYLGGSPGLGRHIAESVVAADTARLYAVVIALGVLGLLVHELSHLAERRVLHWHASYRASVA